MEHACIVVVLLVTLVAGSTAASLREYPPTVQFDVDTQTTYSQKFVDVTCSYTDWQSSSPALVFNVTSADRQSIWDVTVQCLPPTYVYDLSITGYIPRDGQLYITDFCRAQSGVINSTYRDAVNRADVPTGVGRRLLDWFDSIAGGFTGIACNIGGIAPGIGQFAAVEKRAAATRAIAGGVLAAGALSAALDLGGQCDGADVPDAATRARLADLDTKIAEAGTALTKASTELWGEVNKNFAIQESFMANQTKYNNVTAESLNTLYLNSKELDNKTNTAIQSITDLGLRVSRDFVTTKDFALQSQAELAAMNTALGNLAGQVSADLQNAFDRSRNATNALANALNNLTGTVQQYHVSDYIRVMGIAANLRALAGITLRASSRAQDRRVFTRTTLADVARAKLRGLVPFLLDEGVPAGVDPSDFNLPMETLYTRTLFGGVAYEDEFATSCAGTFISDSLGPWQSPDDVIYALGPPNCSTTDASTEACNCFVVHTARRCTAHSALLDAGSLRYYATAGSAWLTEQRLNVSLHCNGAIDADTSELLRSGSEFAVTIAGIAAHTVNLGDNTHVVTTQYLGLHVALPYRANLVNTSTITLLSSPDQFEMGRAFGMILSAAAGRFATQRDAVTAAIDGEAPNGVSYYDHPFSSVDGVPAQCTQSMFMAYSADWIPQYRLLIKDVQLNMVATITNRDTLVQSIIPITNIAYTNALQMQLPGDVLVAGSPFPDENGAIHDVEQRAMSTSPDAGARAGTVSAAFCANPDGCTATEYLNTTKQRFDARSGSNVAAIYTRVLERDSTGIYRCAANAANASGPSGACDLRERYDITPGDALNTTLLARPKTHGSYVATFSLPMGSIQQLIVSTCPTATVQRITADGSTLRFVNARPQSVTLILRFSTECCTRSASSVTIAGGSAVDYWIPSCSGVDGCRSISASAEVQATGDGCANIQGLDVSAYTRNEAIVARGVPDLEHVRQTAVRASDQILIATGDIILRQNAVQQMMLIELFAGMRHLGVVDTEFHNFTLGYLNISKAIADNKGDIADTSNNISATNYTAGYDADRAAAAAKYAEQDARMAALYNQSLAEFAVLRTVNSLQEINLANYVASVNATNAATGVFLLAQSTYLNLTSDMFHTIVDAFSQIAAGKKFGSLDLRSLGKIFGAIASAPGAFRDFVEDTVKGLMPDLGLAGMSQFVTNLIIFIVIGCIGFCMIVIGVKYFKSRAKRRGGLFESSEGRSLIRKGTKSIER